MDIELRKKWLELVIKFNQAGLGEELTELLDIERTPCKAYENMLKNDKNMHKSA